ncbi:MAG: LCP family protein [Ilumatobacteraceae bacterium]
MTSPDSPDGEAPAETPAPDAPVDVVASTSETTSSKSKPWKPAKRRRSWAQRSLLAVNSIVIIACFAGAGTLLVARHYGNRIARVDLPTFPGATTVDGQPVAGGSDDGGDDPGASPDDTSDATPSDTGPQETFPQADPEAKNFLITGADNNSCLDPDSPFAAAFGDRESMGERSDTIMLMRVDPESHKAAVLSFPRDLWVKIGDTNKKNRINSAYVRDDPTKLVQTLYVNFGLPVDHFIQVDFCAFKVMVDAVGGVSVPFEHPARDTHTGLFVPEPGCFTFNGEHALAYVRSRYYQYMDDNGKWKTDGTSDLGRISRQQDFLRRILSSALSKGWDLGVARDMIKAAEDYVVVDRDLTISRMLQFAGLLSDFDPGEITTYQIESKGRKINGNAVLEPVESDNMDAILLMFRGGIPLAEAPAQSTGSTEVPPSTSVSTETTVTAQTVPGVVPPDESC